MVTSVKVFWFFHNFSSKVTLPICLAVQCLLSQLQTFTFFNIKNLFFQIYYGVLAFIKKYENTQLKNTPLLSFSSMLSIFFFSSPNTLLDLCAWLYSSFYVISQNKPHLLEFFLIFKHITLMSHLQIQIILYGNKWRKKIGFFIFSLLNVNRERRKWNVSMTNFCFLLLLSFLFTNFWFYLKKTKRRRLDFF